MATSKPQVLAISGKGVFGKVANYAALPDPTLHADETWIALASQGTSYLPFSLGGTYYPKGQYFSNGTTWTFDSTAYQASQSAVNSGLIDDQFVSPSTFANASKWGNYQLTLVNGTTIKTINGVSLLGSGDYVINSAVWGSVTGILSAQTDLQTALNGKQIAGTYLSPTGTSSQYFLGDGTLATKITNNNQLINGNGYITSVGTAATSLTTTGSSGASTLTSNVLNVPTYTLSGLGGTTLAAVNAQTLAVFAATTSAQLASVISDETGTGTLVFNTSPTFSTDITTPLIIGGTAVGSKVSIKGTTGTGTATGVAFEVLTGTNGATNAFNILNNGTVNFGSTTTVTAGYFVAASTGVSIPVVVGTDASGRGMVFGAQGTTPTNFAFPGLQFNTAAAGGIINAFTNVNTGAVGTLILNNGGGVVNMGTNLVYTDATPQFKIGVGTMIAPNDRGYQLYQNYAGSTGYSSTNASTSGLQQLVLSESSGVYAIFGRCNSAYAGNATGTSIPYADSAIIQSASFNKPILLGGSNTIFISGNTATNLGYRADVVGFRVGAINTLHSANTVTFQAGTGLTYADATCVLTQSATINNVISSTVTNLSTGTTALTLIRVANSLYVSDKRIYSTGYGSSGLIFANLAVDINTSPVGQLFLNNVTGTYFKWGISTTEIMNLDINGLSLSTVGMGLKIKEGANATMGVATLVGGTIVVSTTKVTANSRIQLTIQSLGTVAVPTTVAVTARIAGTSFTITSAGVTDTSVIAWQIIEPS